LPLGVPPPFDLLPPLLKGLAVTLRIFLGGAGLAAFFSLAGGAGRLSPFFPLRWLSVAYIEIFRGTSALVQLFWFYFVLPFLGIRLEAMTVGILVLGLNAGAYGAEAVRGALSAVPKGQQEAADVLNFTRAQRFWRVVLPQAVVIALPTFGNVLIELLKATSLVSLITLSELTFAAQTLRGGTLRTAEIFAWVLALYFLAALAVTAGVRFLERKWGGAWREGRAA
jgi:polar amino acid transport system permease protein